MNTFKYDKFVARWKETTELAPQGVGPLTGVYKRLTHRLKIMPIPTLVLVSLVLVSGVVFFLGPSIASFVTFLQRGF
ncbi:MAG: hypothetical protein V1917_03190 [Candidatus Gottesmanbacteria bacterium]